MEKQFKAIVVGQPSKEMTKSNGNKYVLINCEIQGIKDPNTGRNLVVAGQRGTFNAETSEVKEVPAIGAEVQLYAQQLPSTTEPGKVVTFFSVATGITSASQDAIAAALGVFTEATATSAEEAAQQL